jgi:hypothetical protein
VPPLEDDLVLHVLDKSSTDLLLEVQTPGAFLEQPVIVRVAGDQSLPDLATAVETAYPDSVFLPEQRAFYALGAPDPEGAPDPDAPPALLSLDTLDGTLGSFAGFTAPGTGTVFLLDASPFSVTLSLDDALGDSLPSSVTVDVSGVMTGAELRAAVNAALGEGVSLPADTGLWIGPRPLENADQPLALAGLRPEVQVSALPGDTDPTDNLTSVETDGVALLRDANGAFYFDAGNGPQVIADPSGNPAPGLAVSSEEFSRTPVAIEEWTGTEAAFPDDIWFPDDVFRSATAPFFALAVRDSYEGQTNWSVFFIDSTGTLNWEPKYLQSIASVESLFGEAGADLDGDGSVGLDTGSLAPILPSAPNTLYVGAGDFSRPYYSFYRDAEGTEPLEIEAVQFQPGETYTFTRIEGETGHPFYVGDLQGGDNGYWKSEASFSITGAGSRTGGITDGQSLTFTLPADYAEGASTRLSYYCTSHKSMVGALPFDPTATPDTDLLVADTAGVAPFRDRGGNVWVAEATDGSGAVLLTEPDGSPAKLEWSWSGMEGSGSAIVVAARAQTDGEQNLLGYQFLVQVTDTYEGQTQHFWELYEADANGGVDRASTQYLESVASLEETWGLDLNGDGATGRGALVTVDTFALPDSGGTLTLKEDDSGFLYVRKPDGTELPVARADGSPVRLQRNHDNPSAAFREEVVALAPGSTAGTYLLAARVTENEPERGGEYGDDPGDDRPEEDFGNPGEYPDDDSGGMEGGNGNLPTLTPAAGPTPTATDASAGGSTGTVEKVSWIVHVLAENSSYAVPQWEQQGWSRSIANREPTFAQDLNGDGAIGIDTGNLQAAGNDSSGDTLLKASGGELFLQRADGTVLPLTDPAGNAIQFDYSSTWERGSFSTEAWAVEADGNGNFLLAVKATETFNGPNGPSTTEVTWEVHTINSEGVIAFDQSVYGSITPYESVFGADLNGDGATGIDPSTWEYVASDHPNDSTSPGHGSNAYLKKDGDGGVYLFDAGATESSDYLRLVDSFGGSPRLDWSSEWEGGSSVSSVVAVERQEDGTYLLAVRNDNTIGEGGTRTEWQFFTVTVDPNKPNEAVFSWENATWSSSARNYETALAQDLNGDGALGLANIGDSLTAVATDDPSVDLDSNDDHDNEEALYEDNGGALYILESDGSTYTPIVDGRGGSVGFNNAANLEETGEDYAFSEAAYAVEKQDDGSYLLAVRTKYDDKEGDRVESSVNWALYPISADGRIDWERVEFPRSIGGREALFAQDLNGDGAIGRPTVTVGDLERAEGEDPNSNTRLHKDDGGGAYLVTEDGAGGTTVLAITDSAGNLMRFDSRGSWEGPAGREKFRSEAVAAEQQDDGTTLLAVRHEYEPANGPKEVNWEIFTLDANGQLTGGTLWASRIGSYEPDFNQDLDDADEDGDFTTGIGRGTASLADVASDAEADHGNGNDSSTFLKKDADDLLYIVPAAGASSGEYLPVEMVTGGYPVFDYSDSFGNRSLESEAYAVEKQPDGTFLLAVRREEKVDGAVDRISWEIFTLNAQGQLDWSLVEFTESIASYELDFGQDLDNADGDDDLTTGIGRDTSNLAEIFTGPNGTVLLRDSGSGDLFLDADGTGSGSDPFPVLSARGTPVRFDFEQVEGGTTLFKEEPRAVRSVTSGGTTTYRLLVEFLADPGTNEESSEWATYTVDAGGVLDFGTAAFARSIAAQESTFGTDLNGDGSTGASWSGVRAGESGETLEKTSDGALRIVDGNTRTLLREEAGNDSPAVFDYAATWSGGSSTSAAYAVERQDNGTPNDPTDDNYLLAIRNVETTSDGQGGTTTETYWETYRVSLGGVVDWQSGTWSSSIAGLETAFGEDLNGRNGIGTAQVSKTNVQSDTVGERLQRDEESALYIDDPAAGSTAVAIVDASGSVPVFDFTETESGTTYTSESIAVERQDNGTAGDATDDFYLLAVRVTETDPAGTTSTFWETFRVTLAGVLQWSESTWNTSIRPREASFGQDLDGDGSQGVVETLAQVNTDNVGDTLRTNSAGQLYLREEGSNTDVAITDSVGFQPVLGETETRTDGSTLTVEPFAVEGFTGPAGGDLYKLLLRERLTDSGGTVLATFFHAYTLDASARLQWDSFSRTESSLSWESIFNQDFNGVNGVEVLKVAANLETVSTDQTGAGLSIDPNSRVLYIEDGGNQLRLTDASGGTPTFREKETYRSGSYEQRAFAVEKQDNGTPDDGSDDSFLLAVRERETYTPAGAQSPTTETLWKIFTVSAAGVLSWDGIDYRTNNDVDETVFNQDLNGNGTIAAGRSGADRELSDRVTAGTEDGKVREKFGNRAQSDFFAVSTKDGGTVTFFSDGDGTSAASRNEVSISAVQNTTEGLQEKMAGDAGFDDDLAARTDVLNFTVELADPKTHGKIHKMTFALPEGTTDVTYFKLNEKTGEYYEFTYDPATGEGARIESSDPTAELNDVLAVYIRDNGPHDEDSRLGFIRDPGTLSDTGATAWSTNNGVSDLSVDSDNDGAVNLLEYYADTDPSTPQALPLTARVAPVSGTDYLSLQVTTQRATEPSDLTITLEGSSDLSSWSTVTHTHSVTDHGDGSYTHTYRQDAPVGDAAYRPFLRLSVSKATN